MDKLYCAKCGKENSIQGAKFCAFCGGELAERLTSPGEETARLCRELKNTYINYINWSSDYLASRSVGTVLTGLFTGNGDYNSRQEHKSFASDCEKAAEELCANMKNGGDGSRLWEMLDYVLFQAHGICGNEADWMILAAEKYYIPLVEYLPAKQQRELYERYKAFRKKKMNLPAQEEMLKKLKKLSKSTI